MISREHIACVITIGVVIVIRWGIEVIVATIPMMEVDGREDIAMGIGIIGGIYTLEPARYYIKRLYKNTRESVDDQEGCTQTLSAISHQIQSRIMLMVTEISAVRLIATARVQALLQELSEFVRRAYYLAWIDPQRYTFERVSLCDVLAVQIEYLATMAEASGCVLVSKVEPDSIVRCVPFLIQEAVLNLVHNAIKYRSLDRSNTIVITVQHTSHDVRLSVSDTGIGIAQADIPHIFERFYRSPNVRDTHTGEGLGLAIVKKIVDLHAASIAVQSSEAGTVFSISFARVS